MTEKGMLVGTRLDDLTADQLKLVKTARCVHETFYKGFAGTFGEPNTLSPFTKDEIYEIDHEKMYSPRHIPMKGVTGSFPAYMFEVEDLFADTAEENSK